MLTGLVGDEGRVVVERERCLVAIRFGHAEVLVAADPWLSCQRRLGELDEPAARTSPGDQERW